MGKMKFYEVDGHQHFIPVKVIKKLNHVNVLEVEVTESGSRTYAPRIYKFPKASELQKVVVPKFVAEWIKGYRHTNTVLKILNAAENERVIPSAVNDWILDNQRDFVVAWYDGYEVEPEQLYKVEIVGSVLTKIVRGNRVQYKMLPVSDVTDIKNAKYTNKLTEADIKLVDERLWRFAKIVEVGDASS